MLKKNKLEVSNNPKVIVSLTTFPKRIKKVWRTIQTIFDQTRKPDMVILWLAREEFDFEQPLPKSILRLIKRGLVVKYCDNIRSHKKYYYTMLEYPEATVITIDDDTYYPSNLLEDLLKMSARNPNCVCCNVAKEIIIIDDEIVGYDSWKTEDIIKEASYNLVPIGMGGVLYPPKALSKDAFDIKKILDIAPSADDLWLKLMTTLNHIKSVNDQGTNKIFIDIINRKNSTLTNENVNMKKNDLQMTKIVQNYPNFIDIIKGDTKNDK